MMLRWDMSAQQFQPSVSGTSQSIAYEQLRLRQQLGKVLWVCLHAGAGYGKSHLLRAFLKYEAMEGRRWAVLAQRGVAAKNIGGM